jgi:hypothetical protein
VAPYIDAAATKLVTMATTGEGMGTKVRTAFGWVVKGVAIAADYFEILLAAYDKLTAAAGYWVTVAVTAVDKVAHAVDWLERKLGGSEMDLSFLDGLAKGMDEQVAALNASAAEHWQNFMDGKASKAAARTFADNGLSRMSDGRRTNRSKEREVPDQISTSARVVACVTLRLFKIMEPPDTSPGARGPGNHRPGPLTFKLQLGVRYRWRRRRRAKSPVAAMPRSEQVVGSGTLDINWDTYASPNCASRWARKAEESVPDWRAKARSISR